MEKKLRNVLVTGGAGFIGSHLIPQFLEKSHSITVMDNLSTGKLENLKGVFDHPKFAFNRGDIRDKNLPNEVFDGVDSLVHLAALCLCFFNSSLRRSETLPVQEILPSARFLLTPRQMLQAKHIVVHLQNNFGLGKGHQVKLERVTLKSDKALRVFLISNACDEGRLETQRLKLLLKDAGLIYTKKLRQADFIMFNACGHLSMNDVESAQIIQKINGLKKLLAKLIVWGCLPKINPGAIQKIYDGPLLGPEEWDFFADLFNQPKNRSNHVFANALYPLTTLIAFKLTKPQQIIDLMLDKLYSPQQIIDLIPGKLYNHIDRKFYIKIVSGCLNCCTYCSDRLVYKWSRSVPIETILRQFELGLAANRKHFYFVGRDLGSYGYDIGSNLADLLNKIAETYPTQTYQITIYNVSPNSLIALYPKINQTVLTKRIFEIGSHIQSGSERILKLMNKNLKLDGLDKTNERVTKSNKTSKQNKQTSK